MEDFVDVQARLAIAVDELAKEFEGVFDREQVRAMVDESAAQLERSGVTQYVPTLARRFARERLSALARSEGKLAKSVTDVVFVSLTGGGRAQIAAALLDKRTSGAVRVHAAGSGEALDIDPNVRVAMLELGLDLADEYTRPLTPEVLDGADVVVTMGRSVGEVEIPETARHVDWRIGDPAGAALDEVRRVRDDIDRRVGVLAAELAGAPVAAGAVTAQRSS